MGDNEKTICNGNDCIECKDNCVYGREGEQYEGLEYCFHQSPEHANIVIKDDDCGAIYSTTTPSVSMSTTMKPSISLNILYSENGNIVEQRDSFDLESNEATLFVPAHGNLSSVDMIISPTKIVMSKPFHCQVSTTLENISVLDMQLKASDVASKSNNTVLTSSEEKVLYRLNLNEGEFSEDETEELSQNMRNKCKGKKIVKMSVRDVDEETFTRLSKGEIVEIPSRSTLQQILSTCPTAIKVRLCIAHLIGRAPS